MLKITAKNKIKHYKQQNFQLKNLKKILREFFEINN